MSPSSVGACGGGVLVYLVAVGGVVRQQHWGEQLDQAFCAEHTLVLEQEGVLEPAIPQWISIMGETGAVGREGGAQP